jgi:hypothetical protein
MDSNTENGILPFFKNAPEILTVLHNSENSFKVFLHALSITCHLKGKLEILDVRRESEAIEHISVRTILQQWGKTRNNSTMVDMIVDGIQVKKRVLKGKKVQKIKEHIAQKRYDFTVTCTGLTNELPVPFKISQDSSFVNHIDHSILFVPSNSNGFVDESDGKFTADSILFPVLYSEQLPHLDKSIVFFKSLFSDSNPDISAVLINSSLNNSDSHIKTINWKTALNIKNIEKNISLTIREYNPKIIAIVTDRKKRFVEMKRFAGRLLKNCDRPVFFIVVV